MIAPVISEFGIAAAGAIVTGGRLFMEFLSLGEFSSTYRFIPLTGLDACFDGIIGQDFFFRFTAGDEGERGGTEEGKLECIHSFHFPHLRLQVVMLAAFRIPATIEHVPSQMPAASSLATIRSEIRGMGRRMSR